MRKLVLLVLVLLAGVLFFAEDLVVYTYDSFASTIAVKTIPIFEKMYDVKVKVLSFGDAGSVLSRIILEKESPRADVIVGLDQALLKKAVDAGVLEKYQSPKLSNIVLESLKDPSDFGTPYDYGAIAIVYNTESIDKPPTSFEELLNARWKRSLVVEDPRTSSTGLAFLLWTIGVYGEENFLNYWSRLKDSILTVTPGWDEAFNLLELGEADMMVSYATDGAYSYHEYGVLKYMPIAMQEGAFVQVEYASIVKGAANRDLAEKFIDFLLSEGFQREVPLNQWMYPVVEVEMPEAFEYALKIDKTVSIDYEIVSEKLDSWLDSWAELMTAR